MNRHHEEEILTKYYLAQIGHGSELYRGQLYQKGTIACDEGERERELQAAKLQKKIKTLKFFILMRPSRVKFYWKDSVRAPVGDEIREKECSDAFFNLFTYLCCFILNYYYFFAIITFHVNNTHTKRERFRSSLLAYLVSFLKIKIQTHAHDNSRGNVSYVRFVRNVGKMRYLKTCAHVRAICGY